MNEFAENVPVALFFIPQNVWLPDALDGGKLYRLCEELFTCGRMIAKGNGMQEVRRQLCIMPRRIDDWLQENNRFIAESRIVPHDVNDVWLRLLGLIAGDIAAKTAQMLSRKNVPRFMPLLFPAGNSSTAKAGNFGDFSVPAHLEYLKHVENDAIIIGNEIKSALSIRIEQFKHAKANNAGIIESVFKIKAGQ